MGARSIALLFFCTTVESTNWCMKQTVSCTRDNPKPKSPNSLAFDDLFALCMYMVEPSTSATHMKRSPELEDIVSLNDAKLNDVTRMESTVSTTTEANFDSPSPSPSPLPDASILDNITLFSEVYLQEPCDQLENHIAQLENKIIYGNIHGVFLQLSNIRNQGVILKKNYEIFYKNIQQQRLLVHSYPHMLRLFKFTHGFLRKTSTLVGLFFETQALQDIYQTEHIDWAASLIQLSQRIYEHIVALSKQYPNDVDSDDVILCTEQQQALMNAREQSPAHTLDFDLI